MRDDIQFNIDFCIEVQQYANLYDYGRSDYCLLNRSLQDQTWKKIARKFKANTADCKERWKNIRGSYSKYMAKLKKSDHAAKRVKEYYLAPYLFFLDPFLKTRKSKGNAIGESVDESIVKKEAEASDYEDNYNCESVLPEDCLSIRSSQSSARPTSNSMDIEPTEIIALERPKPKQYYGSKRKYSSTNFNNDTNQRVYQYDKKRKEPLKIPTPANTIHPPDPDLAFLHSVLPDMKSMNASQKRNFKMGVLDLAEQILSSTFNTNQARASSPNKLETKNP